MIQVFSQHAGTSEQNMYSETSHSEKYDMVMWPDWSQGAICQSFMGTGPASYTTFSLRSPPYIAFDTDTAITFYGT